MSRGQPVEMWAQGLKLLCLRSFSITADLEVILFGVLGR